MTIAVKTIEAGGGITARINTEEKIPIAKQATRFSVLGEEDSCTGSFSK